MEINPTRNYSTSEVANFLGKDRHTIQNWCKKGLLRYSLSRANGRKIFKGVDIIKAMNLY